MHLEALPPYLHERFLWNLTKIPKYGRQHMYVTVYTHVHILLRQQQRTPNRTLAKPARSVLCLVAVKSEVLPGFEPGSPDSESGVLTITP